MGSIHNKCFMLQQMIRIVNVSFIIIHQRQWPTRSQSNLAKAASNAPHTLHAQDSIAVAVPEICRQWQNLNAGNVTPPMTGPPNNLLCIVLDVIRSRVYARKISSL